MEHWNISFIPSELLHAKGHVPASRVSVRIEGETAEHAIEEARKFFGFAVDLWDLDSVVREARRAH